MHPVNQPDDAFTPGSIEEWIFRDMGQLYPPVLLIFLHSSEDLLVPQPIMISKAKHIK
jgi:hypothetical protein